MRLTVTRNALRQTSDERIDKLANWILPYKQIASDAGLFVIFDQDIEAEEDRLPEYHLAKKDNLFLLQIGKRHLVLLDMLVLECLIMTRKILFAFSNKEEIHGNMIGVLELDEMSIGKIVAHLEAAIFAEQKQS